ncbi:RNA cytidine acetyltransferase-like [Watersipora subatra]|uniref:RNA cytidine acetyltransferase-like n=1 Tax=Watersipora subatra TaxID=2589382 RepID=UPI00355C019F
MVRKKIDNRIRVMIENNVKTNMRSFFVVVGDKGRDQVVILHHIMSKAAVKARPTVLWCYKKDLGFSSNRKKRMREIQKKIKTGKINVREDDPLEMFVSSTDIRYCYYNETHRILGNTYGMCILQDFEAMTPNLLARTIETVEGGGAVVILLKGVDSLRQLYTMTMDVHLRYRTEASQDIVARFNERFILSLAACPSCMVIDDDLNVLPLSSTNANITPLPPKSSEDPPTPKEVELTELKQSLEDTQPVGVIVNCCRTLDQAHCVLKFVEAIAEKTLRSTVALTAARGRGKSAALGLAMSSAIAFGYSNVFVTSPSPENLKTLFEFVFKGFDALSYEEHIDYDIVQSTNQEFNKAIVRVNIYREHRQTIQYIHPSDAHKLGQAELVVIDEAAAIPLPLVKALMGPYLVFMASTVNGYEGTGRSLSLKLIQQLRAQCSTMGNSSSEAIKAANMGEANNSSASASLGRVLHEVSLNESIRYAEGDHVEAWLNQLLCLDATKVAKISSGCPSPDSCELYYVNRDTLFSFHKASEEFLQRIMSLYVSSHYKNTPNDLQMLSDSPAHHIFVLLPPVDPHCSTLPEVLVVLQVCMEGEISQQSVLNSLHRGQRASGDLIPWTISQQFQDHQFPQMSGARVVRIATHPDFQGMGYGKQSLKLLQNYYEGKLPNLDDVAPESSIPVVMSESVGLLEEVITPRKNLPPLLNKLSERKAESLDYLGVSYGLTSDLLRFWKKSGFLPVYLRQTQNTLTGENSCIMLKALNEEESDNSWLKLFNEDFQRRFTSLLSYQFKSYQPSVALNLLQKPKAVLEGPENSSSFMNNRKELTRVEVDIYFSKYDLKRLEMYANKLVDYHLIMDMLPYLAKLYFSGKMADIRLSVVQQALLLGLGLQHKLVEDLEKELGLPASQLLGLFNKLVRKCYQAVNQVVEDSFGKSMPDQKDIIMDPIQETVDQELSDAVAAHEKSKKDAKAKLKSSVLAEASLAQYKIKGNEDDWKAALASSRSPNIVSVKGKEDSGMKRKIAIPETDPNAVSHKKKKKKVKVPQN